MSTSQRISKLLAHDGTNVKELDLGGNRLLVDDLLLRNPPSRIEAEVACYNDNGDLKYDPNGPDVTSLATRLANESGFLDQTQALSFIRTLITSNGITDKDPAQPPPDNDKFKVKIVVVPTSRPRVIVLSPKPNEPFRSRLVGLIDHPSLSPLEPLPDADPLDCTTWQPPQPKKPDPDQPHPNPPQKP